MKSLLKMTLNYNSTRPITLDCKLGYQRTKTFLIKSKSIKANGGRISGIEGIVHRRYPICYVQELNDGKRIIRTRQEQETYADDFESSPTSSQIMKHRRSRFTSFLKIKCISRDGIEMMITFWNPSEENQDLLREGWELQIFNLIPSRMIDKCLSVQSTKGTMIVRKKGEVKKVRKTLDKIPELEERNVGDIDIELFIKQPLWEVSDYMNCLLLVDKDDGKLCLMIPKRFVGMFSKLRMNEGIYLKDITFAYYDGNKQFPVYNVTERSEMMRKA